MITETVRFEDRKPYFKADIAAINERGEVPTILCALAWRDNPERVVVTHTRHARLRLPLLEVDFYPDSEASTLDLFARHRLYSSLGIDMREEKIKVVNKFAKAPQNDEAFEMGNSPRYVIPVIGLARKISDVRSRKGLTVEPEPITEVRARFEPYQQTSYLASLAVNLLDYLVVCQQVKAAGF